MSRVVLTDVDNTLFSWIDYFAPCFRAMVHAVARSAHLEEEDLYQSFQLVFQREGSVEYRRAIQESTLIASMSHAERERLTHIGHVAFGRAQRNHLKPYSTVKRTLVELRQDGVQVVAVTNSGALQALHRIKQLGLSKLLDGLIAWDHDVAGIADTHSTYEEAVAKRVKQSGLPWVAALPSGSIKPNPIAYLEALERLNVGLAREVWIIGDSLHKDLSSAHLVDAVSVWAKYGHGFEQHNFETLVKITHWSEEKIKSTYDTTILRPNFVARDFSDLLEIVGIRQGSLF